MENVVRTIGNQDKKKIKSIILAVIVLVVILIINPFVKIDAGERGVILNWGAVSDRVLDEGLHLRVPIMQEVKRIDVTIQKKETISSAASKDLQVVSASVALNYRIRPDAANKIFQSFRGEHVSRIIEPAIQENVKAVTAAYSAEELITKRAQVKEDLRLLLKEKLDENYMELSDISITNFDFSAGFNAAIESKQKAEQEALRAENELRRIEIEAKQKIETAKAEAESIRIQAQAITQQGGRDYVMLQWIEAWKQGGSKVPEVMMSGEGSSVLPLIDLNR